MPSLLRASLTALALVAFSSTASAINPGFPYGSTKVRGVNLGGWLVLEPWITPSLFEKTGNDAIVDEWTFGQYQSAGTAQAALQAHWDSWITESDFSAIKDAGLNHVRIPIGFWAYDVSGGEPYIQGQAPYLDKAIGWAGKYGLKVIVDLHGAPGSQNGIFDNSGRRIGYPQWQSSSDNLARTNNVIKTLANKYKDQTSVVPIIAPLNEPAGFYGADVLNTIKQYWRDSYGNIRYPYGSAQQSDTVVLIHDAFQELDTWQNFMPTPYWQGVAIDTHIYQVFSNEEVAMSEDDHIATACAAGPSMNAAGIWTIVGEWSPARTDCAKYLNGRGIGARFDGSYASGTPYVGACGPMTGSGAQFSASYKTFLRKYWEAQARTYEQGAGWIQWAWKAENADDWSYQAGLQYGWIPQNPTDYQYPNICG